MIEPGDSPYAIAAQISGDGARWKELVEANPQKPRSVSGAFQTLLPGEVLCIPSSWISMADARGLDAGALDTSIDDAAGLYDDSPDVGLLPLGWGEGDARIASALASLWNVSTDDVLVTMYEESGLQPHKMTDVGSKTAPDGRPMYWYGGLIGGLAETWGKDYKGNVRRIYVIDETYGWPPGTWEKIVTTTPIATQMQAIAQIWDRQFKTMIPGKLTLRQFADKMGVSPAAVIHAINYVPAFMSRIQNADSPITKQGEPGGYYEGNAGPKFPGWGLDVNQDGAVSLRDLELHGQQKLAELEKSSLGAILAEARSTPKPPESLAALFGPIRNQWTSITGKPPVTTVGWNEPAASSGGGGLLFVAALLGGAYLLGRRYL